MLETAKQVAHKQVSDNGASVGAGMSSYQREAEEVVVDDPLGGQNMEIKLPMMEPT